MASSEVRRRKQLEKKRKKRSEKQHQIRVRQNAGMGDRLLIRAKSPIHECFISAAVDQHGLGEVIISRCSTSGEIALSVFLIDRHCMGVKDCFSRIVTASGYRDFLGHIRDNGRPMRAIDAPSARRFVEDAVAYADALGLKPHPDYRASKMIFGDINPGAAVRIFEMGRDGKPFFMSGPFQSREECAAIITKLTERCGVGGFDYLMALQPDDQIWRLDESACSDFEDDDGEFETDDERDRLEWSGDATAETSRVIVIDPAA